MPNEVDDAVIESGAAPESSESEPQSPDVEAAGRDENRIPISRAEEMWKKREDKLRSQLLNEFREKELSPLRKQYEDFTGRLTQAQIQSMKAMGWLKDEPEKPLTRDEVEKLLSEREQKITQQMLVQNYEQQIRYGWDQVTSKYPKLATNKRFQDAALSSYAQNPAVPLVAHADALVKELLDPYNSDREASAQRDREEQRRPDRRVVPSGRGAAGGAPSKGAKKMSVAEKIRSRLKELNED